MPNPGYDLLIVAPEEYIESLRPLEDHKMSVGIRSRLLSLEEIFRTYPGRDEAEKVKQCLASYSRDGGTRYAMLVGDCEKFPVRYTKTDRKTQEAHDTAFYPSDLYYADLFESDGTLDDWDINRNGYFGELRGESTSGSLNVDDVDLCPDIAVGRVPASTPREVETYVSKIIRYEQSAYGASWSKNALLIATTDWIHEACKTQDCVAAHYLNQNKVYKLYADGNPCETTPSLNSTAINARINQGVGFVSYAGHGATNGWQGCYSTSDLSMLTNADKLPVIFAAACSTSEFATLPPYHPYTDVNGIYHRGTESGEVFHATPPQPACFQAVNNTESLGEHITVKRETGAIAYVGCVTGAQPWSVDLSQYFVEAIKHGHRTIGGMWNYMVKKYYEIHVPSLVIDPPDWTKVAEFHQPWKFFLFGDPSLRIGGIMANYYGKIDTYTLKIETPNVHTNYKRVLYLKGSFGLAFVYFVREGGQLGTNRKRPDRNVFDVYLWESAWNAVVDIVRNEKPVSFYYNSDSNTAYLYTGDEPIGEEES